MLALIMAMWSPWWCCCTLAASQAEESPAKQIASHDELPSAKPVRSCCHRESKPQHELASATSHATCCDAPKPGQDRKPHDPSSCKCGNHQRDIAPSVGVKFIGPDLQPLLNLPASITTMIVQPNPAGRLSLSCRDGPPLLRSAQSLLAQRCMLTT